MKIRLNGWQRIGIVLSIAWMVGAPIYMDKVGHQRLRDIELSLISLCTTAGSKLPSEERIGKCIKDGSADADKYRDIFIKPPLTIFFKYGVLPVPVFWALSYFVIFVINWVRRGFRQARAKE